MILFQLLGMFLIAMVVLYFSYLKATKHLELLKKTDNRFQCIEDVYDLLHRSDRNAYYYVAFLYLHSPFYFSIERKEYKMDEHRIKRDLLVIWSAFSLALLIFALE